MALGLGLMYAMALYFQREVVLSDVEIWRVIGLVIGLIIPHLLGMVVWKSKPNLSNLLTTALILLLLADSQTPFLGMLVLGLLTSLVKTVGRLAHQPIFNPAAAGLWLAGMAGVLTTWWGISYAPRLPIVQMSITALVVLPLGVYLINKYKRWPTLVVLPLSFLAGYWLITGRVPLVTVAEGTFGFFLLIMATEPKTTPLVDWQEVVFSLMLGGLLAWFFTHRIVREPYLAALLIMNIVYAGWKQIQLKVSSA